MYFLAFHKKSIFVKVALGFQTPLLYSYAPDFKEVDGHIGFGLSMHASVRASVRVSVRASVRNMHAISYEQVHARVLKVHIWIPHGKRADTSFFS